jgi:hemerythrin-like metal-binding protein
MFAWNQSFALGVPHIDAQHKQLFAIANELHQAMLKGQSKLMMGQALDKLVDYTVKHFGAEETLMGSTKHADLARHKLIHDQFTAKIQKLQQGYNSGNVLVNVELMEFLQKWLVTHIQGTDVMYARELGRAK